MNINQSRDNVSAFYIKRARRAARLPDAGNPAPFNRQPSGYSSAVGQQDFFRYEWSSRACLSSWVVFHVDML